MVDEIQIKAAVDSIIKAIGEDPRREGLLGTPERVAEMYAELFVGVGQDPREELKVGFEVGHREMIVLISTSSFLVISPSFAILWCSSYRLCSKC